MTQAERYEKETGDNHYNRAFDVYRHEYVEWLEAGKEKAEQERDEAIKMAVEFAKTFRPIEYGEYERIEKAAYEFLDKHKDTK